MATHSSTPALKIPRTEEPGTGYYPWGRKESGTTERLHFHFRNENHEQQSCSMLSENTAYQKMARSLCGCNLTCMRCDIPVSHLSLQRLNERRKDKNLALKFKRKPFKDF